MDKDKYSDKYQTSSVTWCRVVRWHALPRYDYQLIRNGMIGIVWANHPTRDQTMVGEVLLGPVYWNPMVIFSMGINNSTEVSVGLPKGPGRDSLYNRDPTSLV